MAKRYTMEERLALMEDFSSSGLSFPEYYRQKGIPESTMETWFRKRREGHPGYALSGQADVSVNLVKVFSRGERNVCPHGNTGIEVRFHGAEIMVHDARSLTMVMEALAAVSG